MEAHAQAETLARGNRILSLLAALRGGRETRLIRTGATQWQRVVSHQIRIRQIFRVIERLPGMFLFLD